MAATGFALLVAHASAATPRAPDWSSGTAAANMIVVAVADKPDPAFAAGATPRGYSGLPSYSGSERTAAVAARMATEFGLREVSAWTIEPLRLRCMVYEIPESADRDQMIDRLGRDPRVRIAQPLQEFETSTAPDAGVAGVAPAVPDMHVYNDPYIDLQRNFSLIGGAAAQRWTSGEGMHIAIIDTGIDANHPDLGGRVIGHADFVGADELPAAMDRHGTEVAGVIAAVANNRIGIVGVAPDARLFAYRACWSVQANASRARCNSYTLALALGAAIASDARIINLSLGGPRDPLLEQLVGYAVERGRIVVGAVPANRRIDGFPVGIKGVISVGAAEDPPLDGKALSAPGRDILTLFPGGHFDYASGSSLAAAQVTGAVALLLSLDSRLDSEALYGLLKRSQAQPGGSINVCKAALELRGMAGSCGQPLDVSKLSGAKS
jgi:subtilisin family serine protease